MNGCLRGLAIATLLVPFVALSAAADGGVTPEIHAIQMIGLAEWPATANAIQDDPGEPRHVFNLVREELVPGVAHYSFDLRIGDGPYDVLRIHRVASERRPGVPMRARDSIFLLHGDLFGFRKFIFGSDTDYLPPESSVAVAMAEAGWDVWGIDQPWIHVPADETDHTYAENWGMQFNVDCLDRGIAVARTVRLFTGNGWRKTKLLGYSSGGLTAYAFMNQQAPRPRGLRAVNGFVIADVMYKYDRSDPALEGARVANCGAGDFYRSLVDGGVYMDDLRFFSMMGELAIATPDDPSPFFGGLTNIQAALVAGSVPNPEEVPWYHFHAPLYEEGGELPVGLRFAQVGTWLDFMTDFVAWEPTRYFADYFDINCDEMDVPWDDNLGAITEPMLLLAPLGGLGRAGFYTLDLLGSTDKTIAEFSFYPPDELDFGHIDLWTADNAPTMVWPELLAWLDDHSIGHRGVAAREELTELDPLRIAPNPGPAPYTFSFDLRRAAEIDVEVFDVAGRRVVSVLSGLGAAGQHRVVWDGRNAEGFAISDGVYFARVRTPEGTSTSRFVHLSR